MKSPKLRFGKKICHWLDAKLVSIGDNFRHIHHGLYLLPAKNEQVFMMTNTWLNSNPLNYLIADGSYTIFSYCLVGQSEQELFYYSIMQYHQLSWFSDEKKHRCISNPFFNLTVAEAEIKMDLIGY